MSKTKSFYWDYIESSEFGYYEYQQKKVQKPVNSATSRVKSIAQKPTALKSIALKSTIETAKLKRKSLKSKSNVKLNAK